MKTEEITKLPPQNNGLQCPRCGSIKSTKNGNENSSQRYKCKQCGKNFRSTTGSTIYRIQKKASITTYIHCLYEGMTLRKAAKATGISLATAFAWRHKFLSKLNQETSPELQKQTYTSSLAIPYSEKGQKKPNPIKQPQTICIVQTDNTGQTAVNILGKFGESTNEILKQCNQNSALIPDNRIPQMIRNTTTKTANQTQRKATRSIHNQLTLWLDKFKGVATKYLSNYWAWYIQMNSFEITSDRKRQLLLKCI